MESQPGGSRQPGGGDLEVRVVERPLDDQRLDQEFAVAWNALFDAQQGVANPFCAPEWVQTWYSHFTSPDERALITVHSGDRLVGVAPHYRQRLSMRRVRWASRLLLVGAGQTGSALELPQLLAAPGMERAVLRAVVARIMSGGELRDDAAWAEVVIPRAHGWFEPEWAVSNRPVSFYRHQLARACVVLPLQGSWDATRTTLKRNVKESLRRSRNRLAKSGRSAVVHERTGDLDVAAVDRFFALHRARAELDSSVQHPDAFEDPAKRAFFRDLLPTLGARKRATLLELELDGAVVAAQLVLHAPGVSYVHSSGYRPEVWEFGPVTHLQGEAIRMAAERGENWINMSPGPNVAKLRWSEQLDVCDDFAYGCGTKTLGRRYGLFAVGQATAQVAHAVRASRREPPSAERSASGSG